MTVRNPDALVLYATPPACNRETLVRFLAGIGFLGEPVSVGGETRYRLGDDFFSLVGFLGCSPGISIGDGDPAISCHISLAVRPRPVLITSARERAPRCPACGQAAGDADALLQRWQAGAESRIHCPSCGASHIVPDLDWRRSRGFASLAIYIWNVREGEAVPADILLEKLDALSGTRWQYMYCRMRQDG